MFASCCLINLDVVATVVVGVASAVADDDDDDDDDGYDALVVEVVLSCG